MWTLAFALPLMIGSHIQEGDEHWEHFITLLDICRMLFSGCIHKDLLPYLGDLTECFLSKAQELYGHLLPKEHFMLLYPRLWASFGCLLHFMCLRMKANHQFFKQQVYCIGNYKNIPKSLAIKYQLNQALQWSKSLISETSYGVITQKDIRAVPYGQHISGTSEVIETNWIKTEGLLLKQEDCYICVGTTREDHPNFARVVNLVVWPDLLLVCRDVCTEYYDPHFSAYRITDAV